MRFRFVVAFFATFGFAALFSSAPQKTMTAMSFMIPTFMVVFVFCWFCGFVIKAALE